MEVTESCRGSSLEEAAAPLFFTLSPRSRSLARFGRRSPSVSSACCCRPALQKQSGLKAATPTQEAPLRPGALASFQRFSFISQVVCRLNRLCVCCVCGKVSPSMRSAELAEAALRMKNITFDVEDFWTTFEVIENAELGTQDSNPLRSPPSFF